MKKLYIALLVGIIIINLGILFRDNNVSKFVAKEDEASLTVSSSMEKIGINSTKSVVIDDSNPYVEYDLELLKPGRYNLSIQATSVKNETSRLLVILISNKLALIRGTDNISTREADNYWQKTIITYYNEITNISKNVEYDFSGNYTLMIKHEYGAISLNITWRYYPTVALENMSLNITTTEQDFEKYYEFNLEFGVYKFFVETNDSLEIKVFSKDKPKEKQLALNNEVKVFLWLSLGGVHYLRLKAINANTSINISIESLGYENCSASYTNTLTIKNGEHRYLIFKISTIEILNLSMVVHNDGWRASCRAYIQDKKTAININETLVSGKIESFEIDKLLIMTNREDEFFVSGETKDSVIAYSLYTYNENGAVSKFWALGVDADILSMNNFWYFILDIYAENVTVVPENSVKVTIKLGKPTPDTLDEGIYNIKMNKNTSFLDIFIAKIDEEIGSIVRIEARSDEMFYYAIITDKNFIFKHYENPSSDYILFPVITRNTYIMIMHFADVYLNVSYIEPNPETSIILKGRDMCTVYIPETPPVFTISTQSIFYGSTLGVFLLSDQGYPQALIYNDGIVIGYIEINSYVAMNTEYEVAPQYVSQGTYIIVVNYGDSPVNITIEVPSSIRDILSSERTKGMIGGLAIGIGIGLLVPFAVVKTYRIYKRKGEVS